MSISDLWGLKVSPIFQKLYLKIDHRLSMRLLIWSFSLNFQCLDSWLTFACDLMLHCADKRNVYHLEDVLMCIHGR